MQTLQIALVGDSAVGKSAFVQRLCADMFRPSYQPTLSMHIHEIVAHLPNGHGEHMDMAVRLIDVSGAMGSSQWARNMLASTDVVFLMFDITQLSSFQRLNEWANGLVRVFRDLCNDGYDFSRYDRMGDSLNLDTTQKDAGHRKRPYMVLVACKNDLDRHRMVQQDRIADFASELNLPCFLTSAKTGENVASTVLQICANILGLPVVADTRLQATGRRRALRTNAQGNVMSRACVIQ
ncbi:Ras- protein Rab-28 [Sorochytrium milnesiophthora]